METVIGLFVVLHLLGMATIAGGWLANYLGAARGLTFLVWGARAQLLIGLLLVGLVQMNKEELSWAKISAKLVVALAVVGCAEIANVRTRKGKGQPALTNAAVGLMLVNVLIAVLWPNPEA
jgi:thiamine transporter ThiT